MDLRYAWRSLLRTPGFSLLIVATLALGIGATTTMFSAVWAVFLRPLPFPAQHRLVTIWQADPQSPAARHARHASGFRRLGSADDLLRRRSVRCRTGRASRGSSTSPPVKDSSACPGSMPRPACSTRLGVQPLLGRALNREDDRTRGVRSIVISYGYWQTRFAGDPSIVGKTLDIDTFRGGPFTIVGVMPPAFDFPRGVSIWLSLADWGGGPMPPPDVPQRCCSWYTVVARLKPGVSDRLGPPRTERARRGHLGPASERLGRRRADRLAARHARGPPSPDPLQPLRRGRLHSAHRRGECREPAAVASRHAAPRSDDAPRAGRHQVAPGPSVADRKRHPWRERRARRAPAFDVGAGAPSRGDG